MIKLIVGLVCLISLTLQAQTITKVDVMEHWLEEGTSVVDINNDKIINNLDWALAHEEVNMADKYITVGGSGTQSGDDWDNAYDSIQDGVDNLGSSGTIHIAAGTYATTSIGSAGYVKLSTAQAGWDVEFKGYGVVKITGSSTTGAFYSDANMTSGSIKLTDIDEVTTNTTNASGLIRVLHDMSVELSGTNLGDGTAGQIGILFDNTGRNTRTVSINNGSVIKTSLRGIKIESGASVLVNNSVIEATTERPIHIDSAETSVTIENGAELKASTASGTNSAVELGGSGNTTRDLTITDSTLTSSGGRGVYVSSADNLLITNSTITASGAFDAITVAVTANVDIRGCEISASSTGVGIETENQTGSFLFTAVNNHITVETGKAINVPMYADVCRVTDNEIVSTGVGYGVIIGVDGDTSAHPLGMVIVNNNTVTDITGDSGHGILLGAGVNYATCSYNNISLTGSASLNIGIVIKGEGNLVSGNVVSARRGIYLKGGARNKIINNTVVTDGQYALQLIVSGDDPEKNYIINNIFDASNGEYAVYITDGGHGNNRLQGNDYIAGSLGLIRYAQTSTTYTLSQWQTQMQTWHETADLVWGDNDSSSLSVDPLFRDVTNNDFTPTNVALTTAGINGGYIGATMVNNRVPVTFHFCKIDDLDHPITLVEPLTGFWYYPEGQVFEEFGSHGRVLADYQMNTSQVGDSYTWSVPLYITGADRTPPVEYMINIYNPDDSINQTYPFTWDGEKEVTLWQFHTKDNDSPSGIFGF